MLREADGDELQQRVRELALAPALNRERQAPIDPEDPRWNAWLGVMIVFASYAIFVTAFQIAFW